MYLRSNNGKRIVLMEIDRASQHPVSFDGVEFIRVGSTRIKLKDYPEKERALWRVFDRLSFEDGIAAERVRCFPTWPSASLLPTRSSIRISSSPVRDR